jgi:hypothetical protein
LFAAATAVSAPSTVANSKKAVPLGLLSHVKQTAKDLAVIYLKAKAHTEVEKRTSLVEPSLWISQGAERGKQHSTDFALLLEALLGDWVEHRTK